MGWMTSLADPTRARILRLVERQELTVADLCAVLQLPQSTVSRHLKVLADEGWVTFRALPIAAATLDAALVCLVLVHVAEPLAVLREAARVLRRGGRLLVIDMLAHDRREYEREMGHVWLGFEPAQTTTWLGQAGFTRARVQPLLPARQATGPALFAAVARRH